MKKFFLGEYVDYLKDNPEGYWFKRKLFGWGWMPAKWQGWFVTLAFIVILLFNGFYLASKGEPTSVDLALFFGSLIISIIILIWICYKTGEKPKWTWGRIVK